MNNFMFLVFPRERISQGLIQNKQLINLVYSLKYLIYNYDHALAVEEHIFFRILKASCLNAIFFQKKRN